MSISSLSKHKNINDEWDDFFNKISSEVSETVINDDEDSQSLLDVHVNDVTQPEPTPLYISTKSKMAYFTTPIDLNIFWDIPTIPYTTPKTGVIKKQIKINSKTPEELEEVNNRLQRELY